MAGKLPSVIDFINVLNILKTCDRLNVGLTAIVCTAECLFKMIFMVSMFLYVISFKIESSYNWPPSTHDTSVSSLCIPLPRFQPYTFS